MVPLPRIIQELLKQMGIEAKRRELVHSLGYEFLELMEVIRKE